MDKAEALAFVSRMFDTAAAIADMDLDPAALAEVEEAFIGAGLL